MSYEKFKILSSRIPESNLGMLVKLIVDGTISGRIAKDVFDEMWKTGESPETIIEANGLKQVSDTGAIEEIIDGVLTEHVSVVAEYKSGKTAVFGFLVGQAMKASNRQANPVVVNEILKMKIANLPTTK